MKKTRKKQILQNYFNLAFDYHVGAVALWQNIVPSDFLFSPVVFLLRHSIELLLKALIINEAVSDVYLDSPNGIVIMHDGRKRRIDSIHSLIPLWTAYKELALSHKLILDFSDIEVNVLEDNFSYWDNIDENSTYYRYPYNKDGGANKVEPIGISLVEAVPAIGKRIPYIICNDLDVRYIKKGEQHLFKVKELFDAAGCCSAGWRF